MDKTFLNKSCSVPLNKVFIAVAFKRLRHFFRFRQHAAAPPTGLYFPIQVVDVMIRLPHIKNMTGNGWEQFCWKPIQKAPFVYWKCIWSDILRSQQCTTSGRHGSIYRYGILGSVVSCNIFTQKMLPLYETTGKLSRGICVSFISVSGEADTIDLSGERVVDRWQKHVTVSFT